MASSALFARLSVVLFLCFSFTKNNFGADAQCAESKTATTFIDRIFASYGTDNQTINSAGLQRLMKSLALGKVTVECQRNDTECLKNVLVDHGVPPITDPMQARKRRGVADAGAGTNKKAHAVDWKKHVKKCMNTKNITNLYKLDTNAITRKDFVEICPSLVQQIDEKVCVHYHKRFPELEEPEGPPTAGESWGYGFLAITICSFLSLAVIVMIPCLKKSWYNMIMAYLIALAVGTLAGDALLHLIPHAFIEGANMAAGVVVSKDQRLKQHYAQVFRAMFVFAGIYMFFLVEQIMKLKSESACCGKPAHSHEVPMIEAAEGGLVPTDGTEAEIEPAGEQASHGHGHSHGGDKDITGETKVASVAWMVIVGDGFHNFSDGLAVGAAFSASISSGVSTTIAIFCHELPHELGDFAILLKAGMTIKQAIVYNLVSTVLAYVGLAIGILAGGGELGRHIILCLTAGLFLYISLVDMMGDLTGATEGGGSRLATALCQHLGLLSGIGLMLFISLYEHNM